MSLKKLVAAFAAFVMLLSCSPVYASEIEDISEDSQILENEHYMKEVDPELYEDMIGEEQIVAALQSTYDQCFKTLLIITSEESWDDYNIYIFDGATVEAAEYEQWDDKKICLMSVSYHDIIIITSDSENAPAINVTHTVSRDSTNLGLAVIFGLCGVFYIIMFVLSEQSYKKRLFEAMKRKREEQ